MPETWKKLDRLSGLCETQIVSAMDRDRLVWKITIRPRSDQSAAPLVVVRPDLSDAAHEVVAQAEKMGWIKG